MLIVDPEKRPQLSEVMKQVALDFAKSYFQTFLTPIPQWKKQYYLNHLCRFFDNAHKEINKIAANL